MTLRFAIFLAALVFSPAPAMADADDQTLADRVDGLFSDLVMEDAPGAGVIVAVAGEPLYELYYGEADLEHDVPIGPDTVFHVASISKQFTAYAIMRLALTGAIDLDAPFQTYLPNAPDFGTPITVRQLIHHTSGLQSNYVVAQAAGVPDDLPMTPARARHWPEVLRGLNYPPGTETSYTNLAYMYLADIVEEVSGSTLKDWLQREVFTPLGMTSTHVHNNYNHVVPNRARSFKRTDAGWEHSHYLSNLAGETNVNTTPRDLAKWAAYLVGLRQADPPMWGAVTTPGTLLDGSPAALDGTLPYAAGLWHAEVAGIRVLQHSGSNAQYRANMMIEPESGLFAAILSNTAAGNARGRIGELMHAALVSQGIVESDGDDANGPGQTSQIAFDGAAVLQAMGIFTVERSALPEGFAIAPSQNIPEQAIIELRLEDDAVEARFDAGEWEALEAASSTSVKLGEALLVLEGSTPVLNVQESTVALSRGSCSAALTANLIGSYKHPLLPQVYAATRDDAGLQMRFGEDQLRQLTCASDRLLVTSVQDNDDYSGMMLFEAVLEAGEIVALDLSLGPRLRRLRLERID